MQGGPSHLGRVHHEIGLSNRARQCKVCLLVVLHVKLQSIEPRLSDHILHPVGNRLRRYVVFAPEHGGHGAALSVHRHNVELIAPGALDRGDIEAEQVPVLLRTLDVIYEFFVSGEAPS